MNVGFTPRGWSDYLTWVGDPLHERVNTLIEDARRHPFTGLGKPEPLRGPLQGWWSRRITQEHRLVYRIEGSGEAQQITIARCRLHYR